MTKDDAILKAINTAVYGPMVPVKYSLPNFHEALNRAGYIVESATGPAPQSPLEPMPEGCTIDWAAYSQAVSMKRIADAIEWQNERHREYLRLVEQSAAQAPALGAGPPS